MSYQVVGMLVRNAISIQEIYTASKLYDDISLELYHLQCICILGWNGWTEHRLPQMYTFYNNYLTKELCWSTPQDYNANVGHLTRDEIQVCWY